MESGASPPNSTKNETRNWEAAAASSPVEYGGKLKERHDAERRPADTRGPERPFVVAAVPKDQTLQLKLEWIPGHHEDTVNSQQTPHTKGKHECAPNNLGKEKNDKGKHGGIKLIKYQ
eukprot:GHVT01034174.1.p2 GENE.GHVT01034174.1~~GHVT01034174.1.p2  ORF type:complete len:118 (+),score=20.83 GHVT01034174.1:417-770(+)